MKILIATAALLLCLHAGAQKAPVFLYAGQSNADGREFVQNLPDYMKVGTSPYNPYTHLQYASICGTPTAQTFGQRTLEVGTRYAFCDVANYWIDQATSKDFYAIKCAYGGKSIEAVKPRPDSNTDIEVEAERQWDFTKAWSNESVNQLKADAQWAELKSWGYRYSGSWSTATELQTSTGYKFPETEGLFFRANANRATIDPGKNIGLYSTGIYLIIPKVKPGQYITIEAVTANGSKERGITFDTMCEPYLDCIQGGTASYSRQKNVWWYRDTFTEPQNMTFCVINGGIFIYKVMVSDASPISTSGISPDTATPHPACLYTLSGLQASPSHKGIYICEGKKIVRKEWTK